MPELRSPDRIDLIQPIGLKFRDSSDLSLVTDLLKVSVADKKMPLQKRELGVVPSGYWTVSRLAGFAGWPSDRERIYQVEIEDPAQRYLPTRFEVTVAKTPLPPPEPQKPTRISQLSSWINWATLDAAKTGPLRPDAAKPGYQPDYIPLFPTVARSAPGPRAEVRAHLIARDGSGKERNASWATMTVTINAKIVGLGVADAHGAVVAAFGHPVFPDLDAADAVKGRKSVDWSADIEVFWSDLAGPQPDLAAILQQLSTAPVPALGALNPEIAGNPLPALGPQRLTLGEPLIVRTLKTEGEEALLSSLYLQTA